MTDNQPASLRGLYWPAELIALCGQVNTDALLVMAEILELHKVKGKVFAEDEHFADRFNMALRSVKRHIKELKDSSLIITDTNQKRFPKRIITPLLQIGSDAQPSAKTGPSWCQK